MKKNIRKVPQHIYKKLEKIKSNYIVAGCAITFSADELKAGKLKHLGISLTPEGLIVPINIMPPKNQGKYSDRNRNGFVVVRKDLPKETHSRSMEVPNWGDSWNGTHTVDMPYEKYPRDFHAPRELEILMNCEDKRPNLKSYIIAFQVGEVLDKTTKDFEDKLLEDLNLLFENIGTFGVEAANISLADYVKTLQVSWEILPPGTLTDTIQRIFQGKTPTPQEKNVATERYKFFSSLKPKSLVFGQSGFRRYFGALLEDNLVVFENIEYGNAVYILFDRWEELSKLSRIDLMSGKHGNSFERITHIGKWQDKVKEIVAGRRKNG